MMKQKISFENTQGESLAGLLELPDKPVAYALLAHCFTCGKDLKSASRIARELTEQSIAVLRFDFTGLGNSDGDFSNSNFSSNISDLVAAADFLRREHRAPALLIGHSLGGAAVLASASDIPEAKAVVTIGAPGDVQHIKHLFKDSIESIEELGALTVQLAGRDFTIKRQFLEDIDEHRLEDKVARLKRALLVFHSPLDETVNIEQAQKIFLAAKHPKSFVSLDQADHLLSDSKDAEYVARCIAAWVSLYVENKRG
jgi:uncharacterized protein